MLFKNDELTIKNVISPPKVFLKQELQNNSWLLCFQISPVQCRWKLKHLMSIQSKSSNFSGVRVRTKPQIE